MIASLAGLFLGIVTEGNVTLFAIALFAVLAGLTAYFFVSFWKVNQKNDVSPYTGMPLRYAKELPYATRDKLMRVLREWEDVDNRVFDLDHTVFCRETGRIFPNCVTWTGAIKVDWTFLTKRYRGHFVSWGSLGEEKRKEILKTHQSLLGFQTELSSKTPAPRLVEEKFALTKPGPLYVDPDTHVVVGWKIVPETDLEVLVVQRPLVVTLINVEKKST